jgi:signal peptidase II
VTARRARFYDILALLTVIVVVGVDQWTKALVVQYLSPPQSHTPISIIGPYLTIYYIRNNGAAFSLFENSLFLPILIAIAICVVVYLYIRMMNSGSLAYKIVFGMIIGGAFGNLIDRIRHSGYVVDFIWFRIPQIGYSFAIFNIADACISVGVVLLFLLLIFGGLGRSNAKEERSDQTDQEKQVENIEDTTKEIGSVQENK